jgi:hypothetical protein
MLSVISVNVVMQSNIMLSVITLNIIFKIVIMLCVLILIGLIFSHYGECHSAKCRGTSRSASKFIL